MLTVFISSEDLLEAFIAWINDLKELEFRIISINNVHYGCTLRTRILYSLLAHFGVIIVEHRQMRFYFTAAPYIKHCTLLIYLKKISQYFF